MSKNNLEKSGNNSINDRLSNLEKILIIAAQTKGNYQRFLEAGIIEPLSEKYPIKLSKNWSSAFLNLSPLNKSTVRQSPGLFLANVDDIVYRGATSGSRGQSFIYFAGKQWDEVRVQSRQKFLDWWGINDNIPIINVASRLLPLRSVDLSIIGLPTPDFCQLLLQQLAEKPAVIRGYPSRLCEVATSLLSKKIPPVFAIICTGECLFKFQQTLLENVFGAPVISEYGCQETGIYGVTCPEAEQLHLDTNRCLYEIINGQLVTTDLFNLTMPLVRYQCGDILNLNFDTCPCGRLGLTAQILGRIEDKIQTRLGVKYPGEISIPTLEGIANYRILRKTDKQVDIWLHPTHPQQPLSLEPLVNWTSTTFGEVTAQVFLDETREMREEAEIECDDAAWIHQITCEGLTNWLKQPMLPKGAARRTAQLLKALLNPAVITNSSLPKSTLTLLYDVVDSPLAEDAQIEEIKGRVLLFSCCFLSDAAATQAVYNRAVERLQKVAANVGQNDPATAIDLLIPVLLLPEKKANRLWQENIRNNQCSLDVLNVHHLLYAFELTMLRSLDARDKPRFVRSLKPMLSVLIGDLSFFAPRFGIWLLALWFEMMRGIAVPKAYLPDAPTHDDFLMKWLSLRQSLIRGGQDVQTALSALQESAKTPQEQARFYLERGYAMLMTGQSLEPYEWLEIIENFAGFLSVGFPEEEADGIPWNPILRALVKPLQMKGENALAYRCLVASSPPSSRLSAFDRLAFQVNNKQSVIVDLTVK